MCRLLSLVIAGEDGRTIVDPNKTLEMIRETFAPLREELAHTNGNCAELAEDLLDAVEALDEWLSKGGFLPTAWGRLGVA